MGLDRTPATDLIDGTVLTWHEAITVGREWDEERDAPRIRAAFVSLATTRETWPQPRHFLDALPRVEQKAIAYEVKPLSKDEADKRLADIRKILDEPLPTFAPPAKPQREGPPLAETERELRAHYDRKTAAAGDVS